MKNVYVVFAIEADGPVDGTDEPIGSFEAYAIGATEEIAEAIIDKDVSDGLIYNNAFIQKMAVTESVDEV